jgi:PAS domain S-box-containing protein
MWVFDTKTLGFLAVNHAAIRQYGYSRREFLRMTILDIRPAAEIRHVMRVVNVASIGTHAHGTWRHRRKTGEIFDVETYTAPVSFAGRSAKLVVAIDVSRRAERLASEIVRVQEMERRFLARELHDEVGQTLTGLKLTLQTVPRADAEQAARQLAWAETVVDGLMRQIRELSLNLRPSVLDDLGLLPALHWHLDRYTAQTGIQVAFVHAGIDRRLPPELETAAFRIVQEALTNAARHAGVTEVRLHVRREARAVRVTIEDAGRGIAAAAVRSGAGIVGMRERATLLGGLLRVETVDPTGTRVTAVLPIAAERQHQRA